MKMRRFLCVMAVLAAMATSFYASAAPAAVEPIEVPPASDEGGTIVPMAEETMWYYRIYEGRLQKRLWSLTRGIWLTEWEDC